MKIKRFEENLLQENLPMPNPTTDIDFGGHKLEVEYVHNFDNDDSSSNAGVFYVENVWLKTENNKINITTLLGARRIVDIERQIHNR